MKKVKLVALGLAALMTVSTFGGCSGSQASSGSASKAADSKAASEKHYTFGYTCMTMNNPYFVAVNNAMKKEIEAHGDKLITTDPAQDQQKQIDQVNNLVTQKIDCMLFNPVDWKGVAPALNALKQANIPVVDFDTEVSDMNDITAYCGSDNKNAGKVCGDDLVKRFPNGGKIVILDAPAINSINSRIQGFKDAINGHNFTVVSEQDGNGNLQTSMQKMENILQAHSDIDAIMGGNDPTALGALAACKSANAKKPVIYGVDGSPDSKKQIADGTQFVGTGAQSPETIGKESVEIAYKILKKESFQKDNPVKTFLINKDNVKQYGTNGWQ